MWSQIECNATDENSASYDLLFVSDGTPIHVEHPGSKSVANPGHIDPRVIASVTTRFKDALQKSGIHGVARDVGGCFDRAVGNIPEIRACMLYDIAAVNFDKGMRKMFESRGVDPGAVDPFLADRAFNTRMEIYSAMAFGGSQTTAFAYFGNGPNQVMNGLAK